MLDVAFGAGLWIELAEPAAGEAESLQALRPAGPMGIFEIGKDQLEKIVDRAPLHDEAPIHISLTQRECRIDEKQALGPAIHDAGDDRRAALVAEGMGAALGVRQAQISCRYDAIEGMPERAEHRNVRQPSSGRVRHSLHRQFTRLATTKQLAL